MSGNTIEIPGRTRDDQPSKSLLIVAVACSAGDLSAPAELVSALPEGCGAAFIFVQQFTTGRESLLAEALASRTTRRVTRAYDGLVAEHNNIYVIPPNVSPTLTHARFHLTPVARGGDDAADILFTSLAQEFGSSAVGVILSGGGSDRAPGIRAIREAGGITFAQYPGSARFPNLPISAIDTGCVDFVLRPNEIAHELARISRHIDKTPRDTLEQTPSIPSERIITRHVPAFGVDTRLGARHSGTAACSRAELGIGPAVVRNLIESHGGSVTAASGGLGASDGLGKGSEFTVRLPRSGETAVGTAAH
jgi:hypothetical protein